MPRVERTSAWNEREYGREKWPAVEQIIARTVAGGERNLARVVAKTAREERRLLADALSPRLTCMSGTRIELPAAVAMAAHEALVVESVIAACAPDTELVVELGAGWACNLANVWLRGGPPAARYVAGEVTQAGRRAAERIAALHPEFDLQAVPFDLLEPDIDLGRPAAQAVVFTCHGIAAVPMVPEAAIDSIIAVAREVKCIHVEPIGWQIREDLDAESAQYALHHDYNRNLWSVLRAAEAEGKLALERVELDVVGANPLHSSSLVVWHAAA
jgi:hypothetical protein